MYTSLFLAAPQLRCINQPVGNLWNACRCQLLTPGDSWPFHFSLFLPIASNLKFLTLMDVLCMMIVSLHYM